MIFKNLLQAIFLTISFINFSLTVCAQDMPIPGYASSQYRKPEYKNRPSLPDLTNESYITTLNTGTVITGVLQEDISSKSSKSADVFSIMLPENYTVNDKVLIPQYSKFVGTIVSVAPAKKAHYGNPGNLQVSIQTLVSPEGVSIPVNAFIDYNPNQNSPTDIKKSRGVPLGEWGKSVAYSVYYYGGSLGSRLGVPVLYKGQTKGGKDFSLTKGELLPLRLTEPLDVTPLLTKKMQTGISNLAPQSGPLVNQNNNLTAPATNLPSGNNIMPGTTSPAGPEPF